MRRTAGRLIAPFRIALPAALWCVLLLFIIRFVPSLGGRATRNDFAVYYAAAVELRAGVNPYTTDFTQTARRNGLEIRDVRQSTEPPAFLLLFEPITNFSPKTAFLIWQTINLLSLVGALVMLLGPDSGFSGPLAWTLAALAFAYPPVLSHFWYGQSKLPILLMLVVMARLMARGFDGLAGLVLALAGLLRIYPFALAGYLVLQRRWRAFAYMGVGAVVGGLAVLTLVGPASCLGFVRGLSFYLTNGQWITNAQGVSKSGDNAPLAFAMRLAHDFGLTRNGISTLLEHALLGAINITFLVLTIRATLLRPVGEDHDLRLFSLWVVTAVVLPPVSWDYDMTLLFIPFACLASMAIQAKASRRAIGMAIASYVLIGVWRFSGIGDAQQVAGLAANALRETASLALLAAYLAAYWLVTDSADSAALPLCDLPAVAWRRVFAVSTPLRHLKNERASIQ